MVLRFSMALSLVAAVLTACGGANRSDPGKDASAELERILLGSGDYPAGFTMRSRPVAIDLTEPLALRANCQTIGIPPDQITAGAVLGQTYSRSGVSISTAALRVATAEAATELLDELDSPDGKRCVSSFSSPDDHVLTNRHDSEGIDVLELRQPGRRSFTLLLLAKGPTIAVGLFSPDDVDERLIDHVTGRLVDRLSGRRGNLSPSVNAAP